ncbi:MAG: beta-lactamase family protein [Bacteroidia bacterium]|nr:beta-lactamase family protein [Bacteroidia bacterium]
MKLRYILYNLFYLFCTIILIYFLSCKPAHNKEISQLNGPSKDTIVTLTDTLHSKETAEKLNAYFDSLYKKGLFNGIVLVAQKAVTIYKNRFGYANYYKKDTLKYTTAFQLGSISKQFTAVAVMLLKERGLLMYDDSLNKYFPGFPYPGITIRMLLTHRSGLPNYIYFLDKKLKDTNKPISNAQVIDSLILYHPPRYYPPDKKFDYCNTGYIILASVVEKISRIPFKDFLYKQIFEPAGMENTFVYDSLTITTKKDIATGYLYKWHEASDNFADGVLGDKGIYSTIRDLYIWDSILYTEKLLKQSTLKEAFEPGSKDIKSHRNYGFGWRLKTLDDGTIMIFHRGWWHGFQNLIIRMTQDKTVIIILANRKTRYFIDPQRLYDILYPGNKFNCITTTIDD